MSSWVFFFFFYKSQWKPSYLWWISITRFFEQKKVSLQSKVGFSRIHYVINTVTHYCVTFLKLWQAGRHSCNLSLEAKIIWQKWKVNEAGEETIIYIMWISFSFWPLEIHFINLKSPQMIKSKTDSCGLGKEPCTSWFFSVCMEDGF